MRRRFRNGIDKSCSRRKRRANRRFRALGWRLPSKNQSDVRAVSGQMESPSDFIPMKPLAFLSWGEVTGGERALATDTARIRVQHPWLASLRASVARCPEESMEIIEQVPRGVLGPTARACRVGASRLPPPNQYRPFGRRLDDLAGTPCCSRLRHSGNIAVAEPIGAS